MVHKYMLKYLVYWLRNFILSIMLTISVVFSQPNLKCNDVSKYNVEWNSPSLDFTGSMPTGNGDIGLNVWVEKNGDVLFLIGKTDAFDENSTLLKLGRIRIRFTPNPFSDNNFFRQVLNLNKSEIIITEGKLLNIHIWVDANYPVINVETKGRQKYQQEIILETWRDTVKQMVNTQVSDLFKNLYAPDLYPTFVYTDKFDKTESRLIWYHQNQKLVNDGYEINLKLQGLNKTITEYLHPLQNRIFGAAIEGENLIAIGEKKLVSVKRSSKFNFSIYTLTMHPSTSNEWKNKLNVIIGSYKNIKRKDARLKHLNWWSDFWNRSKLKITGRSDKYDSTAFMVSRAYNLCRYMNACAGRGTVPIKFNGSIFSYGEKDNPDYRRWGGPGFWFQNQRLIYYPMFAQGDFDLLQPWFNMYHNMLPLQKERTKIFFNHDGAFFPETATFWGAEVSGHYGWTPFIERKNPEAECTYLTFYWQNGIEQILMMYDYYEYTQNTAFAKNILIPHADEVMKFYELHYKLDNHKKFHFGPAQSLETYQVVLNPLPEIAGLNYTLNKLLTLPESISNENQRITWKYILDHLPPIPIQEKDGKKFLVPAQMWDMKMNIENPELYAVFPYRLFGIGKKDTATAINTFLRRLHKDEYCWHQNAVDAALLGLVDTAKNFVINRTTPRNYSDSRFPAMWNAFHDWIPDVDHGGNLQLALNYMLLQCEGKEIRLLPCWPKDWNVEFKLHAPYKTIIEGSYKNGKLEYLNVKPEDRRKDIVFKFD
jgi:alpha-L-fucosidase 2